MLICNTEKWLGDFIVGMGGESGCRPSWILHPCLQFKPFLSIADQHCKLSHFSTVKLWSAVTECPLQHTAAETACADTAMLLRCCFRALGSLAISYPAVGCLHRAHCLSTDCQVSPCLVHPSYCHASHSVPPATHIRAQTSIPPHTLTHKTCIHARTHIQTHTCTHTHIHTRTTHMHTYMWCMSWCCTHTPVMHVMVTHKHTHLWCMS
jgi:hypothetical protein